MGEGRVGDHALHLYDDDTSLATTVATFLGPGFAANDAIIAIGTRAHVAAIEQRLRSEGHDVELALKSGRYLVMDAQSVIPGLLRNGLPTRESFADVIGRHIERLAQRHGNIRAFGEIVSLLWRDGKYTAAMRLEDLWNETLGYQPLALVCGYAARAVGAEDGADAKRIARTHTRVIRPDA